MDEHKRLDTDGSIKYILAGENNFENISSIFRFRTTTTETVTTVTKREA